MSAANAKQSGIQHASARDHAIGSSPLIIMMPMPPPAAAVQFQRIHTHLSSRGSFRRAFEMSVAMTTNKNGMDLQERTAKQVTYTQ